jgi:protein phosphatase
MVEPAVVQGIIEQRRADLPLAASDLVDIANQNGGRDNISVVLARVPAGFLPSSGWVQQWLAKKGAEAR